MNNKPTAIVIGGGQTLGAFLSKGLADAGYRVAVADLNGDNAARVAAEINASRGAGRAAGFPADATDEAAVDALAGAVDATFGRSDLLVYSAGVAKASPIWEFPLKDFERSLAVNLTGYFLCARAFARLMMRDGIHGRIIEINSKSGKVGSKYNAGYSAAKFGGVGLTQSLALDLADSAAVAAWLAALPPDSCLTVTAEDAGQPAQITDVPVAHSRIREKTRHRGRSSRAGLHRQSTAQTRLRLSGRAERTPLLRQRPRLLLHRPVHQHHRRSGDVLRPAATAPLFALHKHVTKKQASVRMPVFFCE